MKGRRRKPLLRLGSYKPMTFRSWVVDEVYYLLLHGLSFCTKKSLHNISLILAYKINTIFACIISYLVLCTFTKERVREERKEGEKFEYGKVIKAALRNRPLIGVMVATIGSMLTVTGSSQTYSYIYKEVYHNTDMILISTMAAMPFMIVVFPMIPKLVEKFGKRNVILITSAISLVFSAVKLFFFIENVIVYTALNILSMIGQTAFTMLIWALVSDCLDYSEWKTGVRSDGSMYSLYTFSRKIGSTVASTGIAASLSLVGYQSGLNIVQTDEAVMGIYYLCNASYCSLRDQQRVIFA